MKKKDNHPKPSTIMIVQLIKTNAQLSTTIARQDTQIEKLKEQVDCLKDKVEQVKVDNAAILDDWKEDQDKTNHVIKELGEENDWLKEKVDWDSNNYSEPDGRLH